MRLSVTAFVERNLAASPSVDKERFIRRVTLGLNGSPPTLIEIDSFVADRSPDAAEKLIDRLLASPRLWGTDGTRLARRGAICRYSRFQATARRGRCGAGATGRSTPSTRMPFDRFVTEQLGRPASQSTLDQQIATGFNRNHVINSEGGIIGEEYRVEYVAGEFTPRHDFLGLSVVRQSRSQIRSADTAQYYQFFAFFNQLNVR